MSDSLQSWIARFVKNETSQTMVNELLSGYVAIHPYAPFDPPEMALLLFSQDIPEKERALEILDLEMCEWFRIISWMNVPFPDPYQHQRFVRKVCDALELVIFLNLPKTKKNLLINPFWPGWFRELNTKLNGRNPLIKFNILKERNVP